MSDEMSLELLTVPRAAKLLGVSRDAIRTAIKSGDLGVVRLSGKDHAWPRMTRGALREWLAGKRAT